MKIKNKQASVLVLTLIILSVVLVIALSVSISSLMGKKTSIGANRSNEAFQVANSGIERVLQSIKEKSSETISEVDTDGNCNGVVKNSNPKYEVELKDREGNIINDCSQEISKIASIKSIGTSGQNQRAISVSIAQNKILPDSDLMLLLNFSKGMSISEKNAKKEAVADLIDSLDSEFQVGLIFLNDKSRSLSLTTLANKNEILAYLEGSMTDKSGKLNIAEALENAKEELLSGSENRHDTNPQAIILITDGTPMYSKTSTSGIPCAFGGLNWDKDAAEKAFDASSVARSEGIHISTVGIKFDKLTSQKCINLADDLMSGIASSNANYVSIDKFSKLKETLDNLMQ